MRIKDAIGNLIQILILMPGSVKKSVKFSKQKFQVHHRSEIDYETIQQQFNYRSIKTRTTTKKPDT